MHTVEVADWTALTGDRTMDSSTIRKLTVIAIVMMAGLIVGTIMQFFNASVAEFMGRLP